MPSFRFWAMWVRLWSCRRSWIANTVGSASSTMISPYFERKLRTAVIAGDAPLVDLSEMLAASKVVVESKSRWGMSGPIWHRPAPHMNRLRRRGLHDLVELDLTVVDRVEAVVSVRRIAVLIDAVGAEDALAVLGREQLLDHSLTIVALVAGAVDRVEGKAHRLVAVQRVRVRVLVAVCGLVVLEELLTGRRVLVRRQRRDRALHTAVEADREAALGGIDPRGLAEAVRAVDLGLGHAGGDVLGQLHTVVVGDAAEEHAVSALAVDLRSDRAVVGRLRIPAVVAEGGDAGRLQRGHGVGRETLTVDLLVVQDVGLRAPLLLHHGGNRSGLHRVLRDHTHVGALAGRVVLVGLAGLRTCRIGRESHGGVRRADLTNTGLVQDRDRDSARARVELAEVQDRRLVLRRLTGVGRDLAWVPLARRGGRVVQRHVLDGELSGLVVRLLQGQLDAVDQGIGLGLGSPLEREARIDRERASTHVGRATASSASTTAGSNAHGRGDGEAGYSQPTSSHGHSLLWEKWGERSAMLAAPPGRCNAPQRPGAIKPLLRPAGRYVAARCASGSSRGAVTAPA